LTPAVAGAILKKGGVGNSPLIQFFLVGGLSPERASIFFPGTPPVVLAGEEAIAP